MQRCSNLLPGYENELPTNRLYEETPIWFRFDEQQRHAQRGGLSVLKSRSTDFSEALRRDAAQRRPEAAFGRLATTSTLRWPRQSIVSTGCIVLHPRAAVLAQGVSQHDRVRRPRLHETGNRWRHHPGGSTGALPESPAVTS